MVAPTLSTLICSMLGGIFACQSTLPLVPSRACTLLTGAIIGSPEELDCTCLIIYTAGPFATSENLDPCWPPYGLLHSTFPLSAFSATTDEIILPEPVGCCFTIYAACVV